MSESMRIAQIETHYVLYSYRRWTVKIHAACWRLKDKISAQQGTQMIAVLCAPIEKKQNLLQKLIY